MTDRKPITFDGTEESADAIAALLQSLIPRSGILHLADGLYLGDQRFEIGTTFNMAIHDEIQITVPASLRDVDFKFEFGNSPLTEADKGLSQSFFDDKIEQEMTGGLELPESAPTVGMLKEALEAPPPPRDDRIYVVDKGHWPYNFLTMTKSRGKHFIFNQEGYRELQARPDTPQYVQINADGVFVQFIHAYKAEELIIKHCNYLFDKKGEKA